MKLNNLTFDTWCKNHNYDHDAKWFRELYPFHIFQKIEFDENLINSVQLINQNGIQYKIVIQQIEKQENGRIKSTFELTTNSPSNFHSWNNREWHNLFQIIYSEQGYFITVFSKKEDPSKDLISKFFKGNFTKITSERSLPISELLLKSLILNIAEEIYPNGTHYKRFDLLKKGFRDLPNQTMTSKLWDDFTPFYSVGRNIWICYSFNEEKAHRMAIANANQCEKIIVVYCLPTITKHHRCNFPNSSVLSLPEFVSLLSANIYSKYARQISFLQNHLHIETIPNKEELQKLIDSEINETYPIQKSSINESLSLIKMIPKSKADIFQVLCSFNLLNAWLKSNTNESNKREIYSFKSYLTPFIENLIEKDIVDVSIYIENHFAIIDIDGFQFSFHNITVSKTINSFRNSTENKLIIWKGKKLQPIAQILFLYSKLIRKEQNQNNS
jgi:hypothetical protein